MNKKPLAQITLLIVAACCLAEGALMQSFAQNLTPIGKWNLGREGHPAAIAIHRGHSLIAEENGGLLTYRLDDNLRRPVRASRFTPEAPSKVTAVTVANNAAILAGARLTVVDITDLNAPRLAATYTLTSPVKGLAANDQRCFLTTEDQTLEILDISQPANPRRLASLPGVGGAVLLRNQTLYAAFTNIVAVDVSVPSAPRIAATAPLNLGERWISNLALQGDTLAAADNIGAEAIFFNVANEGEIIFRKSLNGNYRTLVPFESGFLGVGSGGWDYIAGPDWEARGGVYASWPPPRTAIGRGGVGASQFTFTKRERWGRSITIHIYNASNRKMETVHLGSRRLT